MAFLAHLWAPILLSAVLVFLASSLVHMVFKWHASDYGRLPDEEAVRTVLLKTPPAPGQYVLPHCADMKEMGSPDMVKRYEEGPVGVLTLKAPGAPAMGPALGAWFLFNLVVAFCVAYVAYHALPAGTPYLRVFQVTGAVCFLAYAAGAVPASIWMGKPWRITFKDLLDGLIYALVTAGAFGWLWPR